MTCKRSRRSFTNWHTLCCMAAMNSDFYSFPYVVRWTGGDVEVIAETEARVVWCAKSILEHLETADLTASPA
jgi:hypothetical protein